MSGETVIVRHEGNTLIIDKADYERDPECFKQPGYFEAKAAGEAVKQAEPPVKGEN